MTPLLALRLAQSRLLVILAFAALIALGCAFPTNRPTQFNCTSRLGTLRCATIGDWNFVSSKAEPKNLLFELQPGHHQLSWYNCSLRVINPKDPDMEATQLPPGTGSHSLLNTDSLLVNAACFRHGQLRIT